MLVLARKVGERIMVGEDVVIAVISIDRGVVRLGIDAPQDVVIAREEVSDLYNGRPLDHGRRLEQRAKEGKGKTDGATGSGSESDVESGDEKKE